MHDLIGPDVVILGELQKTYLPVPFDHKGHAKMAETKKADTKKAETKKVGETKKAETKGKVDDLRKNRYI